MGLLQKAVETYDAMDHMAGVLVEGKELLAPIGHMISTIKIEITINGQGDFIRAQNNCNIKVAIPVSEKSFGRTSSPYAHPLCDNVGYITEFDFEKHELYVQELDKWANSAFKTKKLLAIQTYVHKNTTGKDLIASGIVELDSLGKPKNEKDMIAWRVEGIGEESGAVYEDRKLMDNYYRFYLKNVDSNLGICMLTGQIEQLAFQHLKGISSYSGNAKLISANDKHNFTYRGRFDKESEALSIGYLTSQKAHNALKWMLANEGVSFGDRRMVCWNPKGKELPRIDLPILFKEDKRVSSTEYREKLERTILGYQTQLPNSEYVIIAGFEAATSGRLSVTYYNELVGSDFLDRLSYWDNTCCWKSSQWGVSSPSLYQIINCAFGIQRGEGANASIETDRKIIGQQMQRLIACRVDKALFPMDIMRSITQKASNLQIYTKNNKEKVLFTACAVIKKYRKDNYKEEWNMSLEPDKKDRSYQYGRLLAVLEKIERDTYEINETRETNAIRLQAFFAQRPLIAFKQIMTQLKHGYYPKLSTKSRTYYEKLIGEILNSISDLGEFEMGKPLTESYLMGYYLQKNALYTKKDNIEN